MDALTIVTIFPCFDREFSAAAAVFEGLVVDTLQYLHTCQMNLDSLSVTYDA